MLYFGLPVRAVKVQSTLRDKGNIELARQNFSRRELEVAELLVDEKSPVEISEELSIEPRTVYNHIEHLEEKTNSDTIVDLVDWFKGWF